MGSEVIDLLIKRKWSFCSTMGQRGAWVGPRKSPGVCHRTAMFLESGVLDLRQYSLVTQNWLL